jgi:hypothetical protein
MKLRGSRYVAALGLALCLKSVRLLILLLSLIFLGLILFAVSAISHNFRLAAYERQFNSIRYPPDTLLIARQSGVDQGTLTNHCGYFVGELRQYSGDESKILSFYGQQAMVQAFDCDFQIEFLADGALHEDILPWEFGTPQDWGLEPDDLTGKVYVVFIWPTGESWFDYRCR